ncbi:hypothetical protein KDA14_03925 [Candidatus Saccharibacteria bacterium]|nr:hypothetical protein [Candidatus Saccharibacteria bacterium]
MALFDDLQAQADANGDGKVDASDIEALKEKYGGEVAKLDELKSMADANGDGKVDMADIQSFQKNPTGLLSRLMGMFGSKK